MSPTVEDTYHYNNNRKQRNNSIGNKDAKWESQQLPQQALKFQYASRHTHKYRITIAAETLQLVATTTLSATTLIVKTMK